MADLDGSVEPESAASISPEKLLETHIIGAHPKPTESDARRRGGGRTDCNLL